MYHTLNNDTPSPILVAVSNCLLLFHIRWLTSPVIHSRALLLLSFTSINLAFACRKYRKRIFWLLIHHVILEPAYKRIGYALVVYSKEAMLNWSLPLSTFSHMKKLTQYAHQILTHQQQSSPSCKPTGTPKVGSHTAHIIFLWDILFRTQSRVELPRICFFLARESSSTLPCV